MHIFHRELAPLLPEGGERAHGGRCAFMFVFVHNPSISSTSHRHQSLQQVFSPQTPQSSPCAISHCSISHKSTELALTRHPLICWMSLCVYRALGKSPDLNLCGAGFESRQSIDPVDELMYIYIDIYVYICEYIYIYIYICTYIFMDI